MWAREDPAGRELGAPTLAEYPCGCYLVMDGRKTVSLTMLTVQVLQKQKDEDDGMALFQIAPFDSWPVLLLSTAD